MGFVGFLCGALFGAFVCAWWMRVRDAWLRTNHLHVSQLELPPTPEGTPRAYVRSAVDAYYVRQVSPAGRTCWFREDTGEPVADVLQRRLHILLGMAYVDAMRKGAATLRQSAT